jgi:hypothetical protein
MGAGLTALERAGLNTPVPLQRFLAYSLAGTWAAWRGASLSSGNVTALSEVSAGSGLGFTGANSPVFTGATPINGRPTIQFTRASTQRLERANTNVIGTGPCTMFLIGRARSTALQQYFFSNSVGTSGLGLGIIAGGNRDFVAAGVAVRTDSTISTTAAEVWVARDQTTSNPKCDLTINGAAVALASNTTTRVAPGATATLGLGSLSGGTLAADYDFLLAGLFTVLIPDALSARLSRGGRALAGV